MRETHGASRVSEFGLTSFLAMYEARILQDDWPLIGVRRIRITGVLSGEPRKVCKDSQRSIDQRLRWPSFRGTWLIGHGGELHTGNCQDLRLARARFKGMIGSSVGSGALKAKRLVGLRNDRLFGIEPGIEPGEVSRTRIRIKGVLRSRDYNTQGVRVRTEPVNLIIHPHCGRR